MSNKFIGQKIGQGIGSRGMQLCSRCGDRERGGKHRWCTVCQTEVRRGNRAGGQEESGEEREELERLRADNDVLKQEWRKSEEVLLLARKELAELADLVGVKNAELKILRDKVEVMTGSGKEGAVEG